MSRLVKESKRMLNRVKKAFPNFNVDVSDLTNGSYLLNVSSCEFAGFGNQGKENTDYWSKELTYSVGDAPYKIELVGVHFGVITYGVVTEPGLITLKLSYASNFK